MNVYSKNVFFHNTHFLGSYHYNCLNNLGISLESKTINKLGVKTFLERDFCIAIYGYKDPEKSKLIHDQMGDISLNKYRQDLALYLYEKGKLDIVGNNWPSIVKVKEQSGFDSGVENWWIRKLQILKNYKYNICLENTSYPYYCTEKIWHAIIAGCLPVYYGKNTTIYESFPENSFIDVSKYNSFYDVLHFMTNLSEIEYLKRYKLCHDVFKKELKKRNKNNNYKTEVLDLFIENLKSLINK